MNTPICDFARRYARSGSARLHMPGHKGVGPLGCEALDITEIDGADALYEATGIIAESERNAAALFGTAATFYATEGSSLCIRAMLQLAAANRPVAADRPWALAARNAHRAFLYAAALCDLDVEWLWPEGGVGSLCACPVTPEALERALASRGAPPVCVFVTSPDYLGGIQDIRGLAEVCRRRGVPLLVDNAHGAYLKFLGESRHPIDLGADLCCDSAHKTLPVLTGGAYLHVSRAADPAYLDGARQAMALFGSTSPSYLILQSLDACNAALAGDWPARLREVAARLEALKAALTARGFALYGAEPMKLTLQGDGPALAARLRGDGVTCEYADRGHVVLMFSPDNAASDLRHVLDALDGAPAAEKRVRAAADAVPPRLPRAMTIRQAIFAPAETLPVEAAVGRVCAAPTVACPPAIPVAVSGEIITPEAVRAFQANGVARVRVVRR